jgi:fucose permease
LTKDKLRILGALVFYFFAQGIATIMLGPLLPTLIERWQIKDSQAGTLFVTLFAGQLVGAFASTYRLRLSLRLGALLTAVGTLAMVWASFGTAHLALFCAGLGIGSGLTAGNIIAGTTFTTGRARWLAILNMGWSIGAITSPALLQLCKLPLFFFLLSTLLFIAGLAILGVPDQQPTQSSYTALPLPVTSLAVFALSLMLYVGIENALGGWLPSYAVRVSPLLLASSISLYYWLAELAGRSLTASIVGRMTERRLFQISLACLIATGLLLVFVQHPKNVHMVVLTALCGLSVAPLYPLLVSFLLSRSGQHPRLGPLFATASLGGALFPWLTGIVSTHFHGLRAGLAVPTAAAGLLLLLSPALTPPHDSQ